MNATATRLHVYVSGAVIFALNHNENEVEIYSKHNAAFHASTGHKHTGGIGDGPKLNALSLDLTAEYDWTGKHTFTNAPQLVPLGSIIPFYDFDGALTFDTTYWAYCNGQTKTIGGGSRTLPDLSGRYLVGFGTDGGADLGTASWDTTPVGNAGHTVSLQHSHTVASRTHDLGNHTHTGAAHTHDLANHTHAGPSHTHGVGTLQFVVARVDADNPGPNDYLFYMYSQFAGSEVLIFDGTVGATAGVNGFNAGNTLSGTDTNFLTYNGSGSTSTGGTGNTGTPSSNTSGSTTPGASSGPSTNTSGAASPGTNNQLSTTQSIQPRSVQVRYLMRIL